MHVCQARANEWQNRADNLSKSVAKTADSGIINSGTVSGALNPLSFVAEKHAIQYYESVRHIF